MSAVLSPSNSFSARLTLAAGVLVVIEAPSMSALGDIVGKLQPAANDTPIPPAAAPKPAAVSPTPPAAAAGNAPAPTATPASAPAAAGGSAPSGAGEAPRPTYDQVRERVLKLSKISREVCVATLAKFTGQNGQPCDHANKMKLEDYAAFLEQADKIIAGAKS